MRSVERGELTDVPNSESPEMAKKGRVWNECCDTHEDEERCGPGRYLNGAYAM